MTKEEYLALPTEEKILGLKRLMDEWADGDLSTFPDSDRLRAFSKSLDCIVGEVRVLRHRACTAPKPAPPLTAEDLEGTNVHLLPIAPRSTAMVRGGR
ncbi:MAG: hypothetical protein JJ926_03940 [Roseitalea sp.]|nr:hypothetical protein [Roseitalea sp.]MBO6951008.1 hypothetical protein [Rhizobiaceae bacterium]MBO6591005.1 hypothetical protein [Roseitalea sp.]MBO6599737.1 hypothetical protein [Roseitalea sp.]MBO6611493.1 hypothetical protein [Roseitalea sp.]